MKARNLESRIIKLEGRARHAGEMLLIWSRPNERAEAVLEKHRHLFDPFDRVGIAPWPAVDEPPAPAWYGNFPIGISERERTALGKLLQEAAGQATDQLEYKRLSEWSDADLWYELLRADRRAGHEIRH
ncbi:hypothetical protein [Bradyrhizobium manausense]|uniref:Uncharacterized protein n=1 Tax=Bradyrhizobium manausense TaxID=989370 RepID=A0A0R3D4X5_9BRAD|nr:hypothetical protein [Bradyrhizobium manausense]KRQ03342.1 hypothetical protein AOQ71_31965 [Bradyrhizobium manausense]